MRKSSWMARWLQGRTGHLTEKNIQNWLNLPHVGGFIFFFQTLNSVITFKLCALMYTSLILKSQRTLCTLSSICFGFLVFLNTSFDSWAYNIYSTTLSVFYEVGGHVEVKCSINRVIGLRSYHPVLLQGVQVMWLQNKHITPPPLLFNGLYWVCCNALMTQCFMVKQFIFDWVC